MILFKNCSVLPELMDGFSEAKCDILTDGKRIKGIYKCGECPFESETVIDEDGRFVLPGFIDMHVHLTLSGDDTRIDNEKSGVQRGYDALKYAQDALNVGFTVLRDVGATHNIAINLRNSINKGDFVGPTIYAWDLIIIDEAHRVAGSSSDVARYKFGYLLSQASPYLLLLTATPHNGKTVNIPQQ